MSPALIGEFLTTGPLGKPRTHFHFLKMTLKVEFPGSSPAIWGVGHGVLTAASQGQSPVQERRPCR